MGKLTATFAILALALWGYALGKPALSALMIGALILSQFPLPKLLLSRKAWARGNGITLVLIVLFSLWFYMTRASNSGGLAPQIFAHVPLILFPKLLFIAFARRDEALSARERSLDGISLARASLDREQGLSQRELDAKSSFDFPLCYALFAFFIALMRLPQRPAIFIAALGLCAICVLSAWNWRRETRSLWVGALFLIPTLMIGAGAGFAYEYAQNRMDGSFSNFLRNRDANGFFSTLSADTAIGTTGSMSAGGKLLYRVEWEQARGYLRYGIFSDFQSTSARSSWHAAPPGLPAPERQLFPNADNAFILPAPEGAAGGRTRQAQIATNLPRERSALALPLGAEQIFGLPLNKVEINRFGTLSTAGSQGFVKFGVLYNNSPSSGVAPGSSELALPNHLIDALDTIIEQAKLTGLPPKEAAAAIKRHFAQGWQYTLELTEPDGATRSLRSFLLRDRRGHCEYFATASALLLRRLGVPARYETGFLVSEYQPEEQAYWVRVRDAHAWTSYWDGSAWQQLDATVAAPPGFGHESSPIADFFSRLQYKLDTFDAQAFSQRLDSRLLWGGLACLIAVMAWRISRTKRAANPSRRDPSFAEKLTLALERQFRERRLPQETSAEFWRRCATQGPLSAQLLEAASMRERTLFSANPTPEPTEREALKALTRAILKLPAPKAN